MKGRLMAAVALAAIAIGVGQALAGMDEARWNGS